jgi:simple sugar transport system ATP-binding protein
MPIELTGPEGVRRPGAAGPPVAEAEGISKRFGSTQALTDTSLAVYPGESHALVGRNGAGKSTLVAILTGLQAPDAGEVRFGDEPAPPTSDRKAWQRAVACVYQHSTVIPHLTVAENLFLNRQPRGRMGVKWRAMNEESRSVLLEWDVDVEPTRLAADLDVEQRQLVEIARALSLGSRFIILDEPTAQLDGREIARLFGRIQRLQDAGVTFLYISHHLKEIYEICQRVTVLRDGRLITTGPMAELPEDKVVAAMVGAAANLPEQAGQRRDRSAAKKAKPLLEVRDVAFEGWADSVSFTVHAGECVGLAGLVGSGKAAVGDAIAGLEVPAQGEIVLDGDPLPPGRADVAIKRGIGYVPQDRHARGLCPHMSVANNATLTLTDELGEHGLIRSGRLKRAASKLIADLDVKTSSANAPVTSLSGGNQQKTVMARALAPNPKLLVLLGPTAGVDIASKRALFATIDGACAGGKGALVISDELEELRICDRVLVLVSGELVREFPSGWRDDDLVATMEGLQSK